MNPQLKTQPLDRMIFLFSAVQEPLIRCLIRFQDHIDQEALMRAVALIMDAVPQIGCTFDEAHLAWRAADFSPADVLHIENVPNGTDPDPYILSSNDWARMPQIKAYLLRESTRDSLVLIVNHTVMDGAGFKQLIYLFGELYSKCESDASYRGPIATLGERGLDQVLNNLRIRDRLRILRTRTESAKPDPAMRLPLAGDSTNPILVASRVDAPLFESIRRWAKGQNASLNDVLLAAYLRTLRDATGCAHVAVPCPVDLRRFARPGQRFGICNLTGSYACGTEIADGETFIGTLAKVSDQMRAQKTSDACLKGPMQFHIISRLLPRRAVRAIFYRLAPPPVVGYTNLGVLDDARLRFGRHEADDAFISTALKKPPYFQLSVSSYRGACLLTSSLYGTESDRVQVQKMHAQIISEMENAAHQMQNKPASDC